MKIKIISVLVDDQAKALSFYTGILGFVKKHDVPLGDHRWLTVVSPELPHEAELLLEPMGIEAARVYQKALYDAGIPFTMFHVDDIEKEYKRLVDLGVKFSITPTPMGPVKLAVFEDTCGNRIQIVQA